MNVWKNFLTVKDTNTHLYEELVKFHGVPPRRDTLPGFILENFNEQEISTIIPLYKSAFGFRGVISKTLFKELKNGFFLRIFSEVYSNKEIPEKIKDKELIRKYLKQSIDKTGIGFDVGLRILGKICKALISHEYTSIEVFLNNGLEIEHLRNQLDLPIDENLPEDFFSRNILIRSACEDSYHVSFYFSKIRDYIICFHTYRLDKLKNSELYAVLPDFYENHIGHSAIDFYIENASFDHLNTIRLFKMDKALAYVNGYETYLDTHLKVFKEKFDPKTLGRIGIMLPKDPLKKDGYALYPLPASSSDKISYENLDSFGSNQDHYEFFERGVNTIYGSNNSIMIADQGKIIRANIFKQLKEIIQKGKFIIQGSEILLKEAVVAILYNHHKKLNCDYILSDYYLPRPEPIYPLDLKTLRTKLYTSKVTSYYRGNGTAPGEIEALVSKAVKENLDLPTVYSNGNLTPLEALLKTVDLLLDGGIFEIKEHYLPIPDKTIAETKLHHQQMDKFDLREIRSAQYSHENAKFYIEKFFSLLEHCYGEFVEFYFPTYKERFEFYTSRPHEYFYHTKDSDVRLWGWLGHRPSKTGILSINFEDSISFGDKSKFKDGIKSFRAFSLDSILHFSDATKSSYWLNDYKTDEFCVLRNWVIRLLKEDMRSLFEENGERI